MTFSDMYSINFDGDPGEIGLPAISSVSHADRCR